MPIVYAMRAGDPDEEPSVARAAGWVLDGFAGAGIVGALWALGVATWAILRSRGSFR
jgi:hypothetical protein